MSAKGLKKQQLSFQQNAKNKPSHESLAKYSAFSTSILKQSLTMYKQQAFYIFCATFASNFFFSFPNSKLRLSESKQLVSSGLIPEK